MDRMWGVMQVVLPVVAILLAGALVRRKKLATAEGMGQLKGVLVNICLPAVLFRTFYAMEFNWKETGIFFLMGGVTLTGFLLGFLMRRLLRARYGILPWLCTTIEGGQHRLCAVYSSVWTKQFVSFGAVGCGKCDDPMVYCNDCAGHAGTG